MAELTAAATARPNPVAKSLPISSIKTRSVRGGAAAILGQCVSFILQIGTLLILARFLSPADYGLQSMVVTFTAFVTLFKDAGLTAAAVQRESLTEQQISSLFWLNVGLGALLTVLVCVTAPVLAKFYHEPRVFWITIASASVFLFSGLSAQHRALLDRSMRFTTSVRIDMLSGIVGALVAIVMAARGLGYWALIVQTISLAFVGTIAVWIAVPFIPGRPKWTPELRSIARVGGTLTLNAVVVYVAYNAEKVLLGRYWGAAPLGVYGRAYQLANLPIQQLFSAVYVVAFSALARVHGDTERLVRGYLKSQTIIVSLTIPVVVCSAFFANEIVTVLLGAKWIDVAPVMQLLAPAILVFALVNPFSWLLQSSPKWVGRSLNMAFLIAPVVILGIIAGLGHGPRGVALGYSVAMLALFTPIVLWALHGTGITLQRYWESVKPPLVAGPAAAFAGWAIRAVAVDRLSPAPLLVLEVTIFSAVYLWILLFGMKQRGLYEDLFRTLRERDAVSVQA